ncbi:sugar transferase [Belliella sp. R4-6]|uniref:Sugar transferase n=1 Tax=Belliella alkalica TaxID=1730871 RepID=A0ABS9V6J0_9BACT|nr:sugar transferase [Belliella alkalica]
MYKLYIKRFLDLSVSLVVLILVSPVFIFTYLALLILNNGKVFFYQERPGLNQEPFYIIKFKTMNDRKDKYGKLLPDKSRLTIVGNYVRKLSIDELPQLINVIRGEMSLIGPRPLLYKYIHLYSANQNRRHDVKPGITGWAQINGRNSISWTRKFELDVEYVDNLSFQLDFKIFCLTIFKIIQRDGVNQSSERPMEPFNGVN